MFQQDLKFDQHIDKKNPRKATKILGAIKHMLQSAPIESQGLGQLILKDTLWDPTSKQTIESIKSIQLKAVKRRESVTKARNLLKFTSLESRRQNPRYYYTQF